MAVTLEQVLNHLRPDEPNYQQAARLGVEAIHHIMALVKSDEPSLAARAAFLAGYINAADSISVLQSAAQHPDPVVRVAAASSARRLTTVPSSLILTLLDDADVGVRKSTLRTLEVHRLQGVKAKVEAIIKSDPHAAIRERASRIVGSLP